MSVKERIFHCLLFEIIALTILVSFSQAFSSHNPASVGGLAIGLSLSALSWNFIYNLGFDKVFGANRLSRRLLMRLGHGTGFEIGLLIVTTPLIMWVLELGFFSVIILNLGLSLFFFIYAIVFNWTYDNLRENFKSASV
jgi:uncharacterized membrane protein